MGPRGGAAPHCCGPRKWRHVPAKSGGPNSAFSTVVVCVWVWRKKAAVVRLSSAERWRVGRTDQPTGVETNLMLCIPSVPVIEISMRDLSS